MSLFWQTILQVSGVCLWIELSYFTLFLVLECFFGNPDDVLVRFYILLIAVPISVFKSKIYKQFRWSDECKHSQLMIVQTYIVCVTSVLTMIIRCTFLLTPTYNQFMETCSHFFRG